MDAFSRYTTLITLTAIYLSTMAGKSMGETPSAIHPIPPSPPSIPTVTVQTTTTPTAQPIIPSTAESREGDASYSAKLTTSALTHQEFDQWWNNRFVKEATNERIDPEERFIVPVSVEEPAALEGSIHKTSIHLQSGDVLHIDFPIEKDLSTREAKIATDGCVYLQLVGCVPVEGLTIEEAQEAIKTAYREYLKYPSLTVAPGKMASRTIYAFGAVGQVGPVIPPSTDGNSRTLHPLHNHLSHVIMGAQGLLPHADLSHIKIFHPERRYVKTVDLNTYLTYGNTESDVLLQPGEAIYIPRRADHDIEPDSTNHGDTHLVSAVSRSGLGNRQTYPIRVYGYVESPDVYLIESHQMDLQTILAKAGINLESGDPNKIIIARTLPNHTMATEEVDATEKNPPLHPNDIVIVSKKPPLNLIQRLFNLF